MVNTIIAVVLVVWFVTWVSKNYGSTSTKAYFEKLLASSHLGFAKLDFEMFGMKEEREELRKEYDRQNEYMEAYKAQAANKENTAETIKQFEQKIAETTEIINQLQDAINQKDIEIRTTETTQEDLHKQMRNLVTYIEREF